MLGGWRRSVNWLSDRPEAQVRGMLTHPPIGSAANEQRCFRYNPRPQSIAIQRMKAEITPWQSRARRSITT